MTTTDDATTPVVSAGRRLMGRPLIAVSLGGKVRIGQRM